MLVSLNVPVYVDLMFIHATENALIMYMEM